MLNTTRALGGMVTSPHHAASQAGLDVLREGGSAVQAAIAAASTLAVIYPQMNSIGGDGFWLIAEPGQPPIAIEACGRAAAGADAALYRRHGHADIPWRGPLAANTVAGTISGWQAALAVDRKPDRRTLPLERLLRDAIHYAEAGFAPARSTVSMIASRASELRHISGFADLFLPGGGAPTEWSAFRQPALGRTLRTLAENGLESFYRGPLAASIARDLASAGSPVTVADLAAHEATIGTPLHADIPGVRLYNTRPPTQGVASLMILALFSRLGVEAAEEFDHIHGLVEATKRAFLYRDAHVQDPDHMDRDAQSALEDHAWLDATAAAIDPHRALAWPSATPGGDTVWLGVIDAAGQAVSMIQSTYFEFGSGIVLPDTGIVWQNRGASFGLGNGRNALRHRARPFHTLNPAMARFQDERTLVYGTMGGEGQPQTQAAIFSRYALFGQPLQHAVTAPRWLLGRTWGDHSTSLKLEARFDPALIEQLRQAGHVVELVSDFSDVMGHAGAIVHHAGGVLEGAADPRSDGAVAAL
jgi:gamma-glutamyltranspeptidase/glutathione hydrolase